MNPISSLALPAHSGALRQDAAGDHDPERQAPPPQQWTVGGTDPSLPEFTFVMRIHDVHHPLPIQVHPNQDQTLTGFVREKTCGIPLGAANRLYKDRLLKPEIAVGLTPARILAGQRSREDLARLAGALKLFWLKQILAAAPEPPIHAVFRLPGEYVQAAIEETVSAARAAVAEGVAAGTGSDAAWAAADSAAATGNPVPSAVELILTLAAEFPGDRGLLVALCMNLLPLAPGRALFIPPGQLHGYLSGAVVQFKSPSENVLMAGLTREYVDVPEIQRTLTAPQLDPAILLAEHLGEGKDRIPLWREDVDLRREIISGDDRIELPGPSVLFAIPGPVHLEINGTDLDLPTAGGAQYQGPPCTASVSGSGKVFVVSPH